MKRSIKIGQIVTNIIEVIEPHDQENTGQKAIHRNVISENDETEISTFTLIGKSVDKRLKAVGLIVGDFGLTASF